MSGISTYQIWDEATVKELQKIRAGKVGQANYFAELVVEAGKKADYYKELRDHRAATLSMLETEIAIIDRVIERKKKEVVK